MKQPMQPVYRDNDDTIRFQANQLVRDLVDGLLQGNFNTISALVARGRYSQADYEQLMQLWGYTVTGYCELGLVSEESKDEVERVAGEVPEASAP